MNLLSEQECSLQLPNAIEDAESVRSEIIVNAEQTGLVVDGAFLEAAVSWRQYLVAFLTGDVAFEDALRIYLIDQQFRIVDRAAIGMAYSTGSFTGLALHEPDTVTFQFMGDGTWALELLERQEWALPLIDEPLQVHRTLRLRRHFRICYLEPTK